MANMNLFPTDYSHNDVLFGRLSLGTEIDLRKELSIILRGSPGGEPQRGHWVIYRRYDLSRKSQYYNETTGEGKGGPAWEYTDELWLTRRVQLRSGSSIFSAEQDAPPGLLPVPYITYYFEHTLNPKIQDEIYEFEWADHTVTPTLDKIKTPYTERQNIKLISPYRDIGGRLEYYAILVMGDVVSW